MSARMSSSTSTLARSVTSTTADRICPVLRTQWCLVTVPSSCSREPIHRESWERPERETFHQGSPDCNMFFRQHLHGILVMWHMLVNQRLNWIKKSLVGNICERKWEAKRPARGTVSLPHRPDGVSSRGMGSSRANTVLFEVPPFCTDVQALARLLCSVIGRGLFREERVPSTES
ncbi:hypothetical protein HJG60_011550 [Phyllostomus discolor]|uniref:Uncharacterized protein n=1 Tax=Phyllostomus discolor TaxID=89673 RepID=A0A833ZTY2_9CHIR|nr:hypothetical protein HJG60_011550 [Phyllostomus discolor]